MIAEIKIQGHFLGICIPHLDSLVEASCYKQASHIKKKKHKHASLKTNKSTTWMPPPQAHRITRATPPEHHTSQKKDKQTNSAHAKPKTAENTREID
jgi:hypothetical protein